MRRRERHWCHLDTAVLCRSVKPYLSHTLGSLRWDAVANAFLTRRGVQPPLAPLPRTPLSPFPAPQTASL